MNEDVERYLDAMPADRKALLETLHRLILELYPDAEVDLAYRMPTYRSGEGWVAVANQKYYVSLYTCGEQHLAEFKALHPETKTGKGCINFKPGDPLPTEAVQNVIRHAIEHPKPE